MGGERCAAAEIRRFGGVEGESMFKSVCLSLLCFRVI